MRINIPALLVAVAALAACTAEPVQPGGTQPVGQTIAEGTVTQIRPGHGNLHTSIGPDAYEALGLEAGQRIHATFNGTAVTMDVGEDYTDVPSGEPVLVLHREGLTFAVRDENFSETYGITAGTAFTIATTEQTPR